MSHTAAASELVGKIRDIILDPLLILLTAIALLVFFWGAFQYVQGVSNGEPQDDGKRHMLWGIVGLVIMLSAFTLLRIATNTFGIDIPN